MNLSNFWYGSCSYGVLWENHTLYAGKILVWRNFGPFNPTGHGYWKLPHSQGGYKTSPPIFFRKLYIVWSFGGYMHVYTHKTSLHDNFQTSTIFACGAMTHFWAKMTSFWTKNQTPINSVKMKVWSWNLVRILILMVNFQK